jgi:gamma-glutamyltranspeptidase/glutathione hydrolase
MAQALGPVYAARRHVADPAFVDVPTKKLASPAFIDGLRRGGGEEGDARLSDPRFLKGATQTSHLSVLDGKKNAVAITESLECFFGSGIAVPGTGIFLNDIMHDFDPTPGGINSIEPGKRPMSSMSPTVFLKDGAPWLVVGSAAGPRIITAVLQVVLNIVEHGMNVQEAIAAPRFHFQGGSDKMMWMEGRVDPSVRADLKGRGYRITVEDDVTFMFGGVHAILSENGRIHAGADIRRDGAAAAY